MAEYLDLDYCADNFLSEDEAWRGARVVAATALEYLMNSGEQSEAHFSTGDIADPLYEILGYRDLTGPIKLEYMTGDGRWSTNLDQRYRNGVQFCSDPVLPGDIVTLTARQFDSEVYALGAVMPTDGLVTQLMREGSARSMSAVDFVATNLAMHYREGLQAYNKKIRAAAWLTREVLEGRATPVEPPDREIWRRHAAERAAPPSSKRSFYGIMNTI